MPEQSPAPASDDPAAPDTAGDDAPADPVERCIAARYRGLAPTGSQ